MTRRSSIHRDLRSPKYRRRVVTPKKTRKERYKPDRRSEAADKDSNGTRRR
jgi:hypothetical protein